MGNAVCMGKKAGLDSLCAGRGFPEFIAPNTEHVTYLFNHSKAEDIRFADGVVGALLPDGFALETSGAERRAPRWYTVKDYTPGAARLRLHTSGRVFVQCAGAGVPSPAASASACAFRLCTRGRRIDGSVKTKTFTHTAQVSTSGVFFAVCISSSPQGLFLCPRLVLVLEGSDEVVLVDDRLGPLQPWPFYLDFAVLDDGGRNLQLDLILRGAPGGSPEECRTVRTCLQDYTAFNSQVQPAVISVSSSDLGLLLPGTSVFLQHLVVSEERFEEAPEPQPYGAWREAACRPERQGPCRVLFEGEDSLAAAAACMAGQPAHPQLQGPRRVARGGNCMRAAGGQPRGEEFWHHIRYDDDLGRGRLADSGSTDGYGTRLKGEFWLSKQAVDKKHVYFQCSSTLAQAMTMCIVFRFSCPLDYLQLIEQAGGEAGNERREAVMVLREWHIPANGVVVGIEHDPRHRQLLRMFMEHRNEIKDDMVVCECRPVDLMHSVVHQEVYDAGSHVCYRITLLHRDGGRQSAVLQMSAEEFEDAGLDSRSGGQYRLVEEPSPRFPISPCPVTQNLSPANRVFVYSAAACQPREPEDEDEDERPEFAPSAEDWHSAAGGGSDCEEGHMERARGEARVEWRRPLVESAVLLSRLEEAPFKCFPASPA